MAKIVAVPTDPDSIEIDVTIRAKLGEWKQLRKLIKERSEASDPLIVGEMYGGVQEPFWTLVYRLGDVLSAVEKQHTNYPS